MEFWGRCDNLVQQGDDVVTLGLGDADNLCDEARVEENALPASNRVSAHKWVFSGDWLAAYSAAKLARTLRLHFCRMHCCERLQVLLHVWAEHIVGSVLGGPEGIATSTAGWASQNLQGGIRRRLNLVCDLCYVRVVDTRRKEEYLRRSARGR